MRRFLIAVGCFVLVVTGLSCEKRPSPGREETKAPPVVIPPPPKKQGTYFPEGTPTRAIQDLDDLLETYILNPKTEKEKRYNTELKSQVLHGTFDMRELCRLALDKHWGERSDAEREVFVDLMIRLLERKAVFSREQGQQKGGSKSLYKIVYEGDRSLNPDKTQALVRSTVHIPSEDLKIELHYKLKKASSEGGWKIYDVIVDEASLLDNYKYQFDKIIAKDGYPALVHRMESKLKALMEETKK